MASGNNRGNSNKKSGSRKKNTRPDTRGARNMDRREEEIDYSLRSEITVIASVALTIFLFLCNFGICGSFGNALSSILFGLFGITAFIAPLIALAAVVIGIANFGSNAAIRKIVSGLIIFVLIGILA